MVLFYEHSDESGGHSMNKDINRYQAKTVADILLCMVVATGLFAMVVYSPPVHRADKSGIILKQNINNSFSFDFKSHYKE